jgi:hypothetical protein
MSDAIDRLIDGIVRSTPADRRRPRRETDMSLAARRLHVETLKSRRGAALEAVEASREGNEP